MTKQVKLGALGNCNSLSRVGVLFTEAQKKVIEKFLAVGDTASAQKTILDILKTEFDGQDMITNSDTNEK